MQRDRCPGPREAGAAHGLVDGRLRSQRFRGEPHLPSRRDGEHERAREGFPDEARGLVRQQPTHVDRGDHDATGNAHLPRGRGGLASAAAPAESWAAARSWWWWWSWSSGRVPSRHPRRARTRPKSPRERRLREDRPRSRVRPVSCRQCRYECRWIVRHDRVDACRHHAREVPRIVDRPGDDRRAARVRAAAPREGSRARA